MRWVICALVVLIAPAGARAGDFDALRGSQPVGYASYTRWSGFYGGGLIGEEFDAADFRNVGASEITTISGLDAGFDGIPLSQLSAAYFAEYRGAELQRLPRLQLPIRGGGRRLRADLYQDVRSAPASTTWKATAISKPATALLYLTKYNVTTSADAKVDDYGTVRGRFGWAFGNLLPYAFGGVSISQINAMKSVNVNYCGQESPYTCANPPPPSIPPPPAPVGGNWTLSNQVNGKWYFGYVAGLGLDYALTQNIFLRGEFQYIQFGAPDNIRLSASSVRVGAGVKF